MIIKNSYSKVSRTISCVLFLLTLGPLSIVPSQAIWPISTSDSFRFLTQVLVPAAPELLTQNNSTRALALESTTFRTEPFELSQRMNFGTDPRTRIMLFAKNLDGAVAQDLSVDAEDEQHRVFPLAVEYIYKLPVNASVYAVFIRLDEEMSAAGDVLVRLQNNGLASNRVRVGIRRIGGGLPDDPTPNPQPSPSPNATPVITDLSPFSITAGAGGIALLVEGLNFTGNSIVRFDGNVKSTTYVSDRLLMVPLSFSDVQTAAVYSVTVKAPGQPKSNSAGFTIKNPQPTISSLSPSSVIRGSAGFILTVVGNGFVNGSVVKFNGNNRVTTFVSATLLTAQILAADLNTAGSRPLIVNNPSPGGGNSNSVSFTVVNPGPLPSPTPTPIPAPTPVPSPVPTPTSGSAVIFSTSFGGSTGEQIRDIATDSSGNIYITGGANSVNFPTTVGAFDRTHNGSKDVFVAKFSPTGTLMWSTFLGGPNYDRAYAIEVDATGVYVGGRAGSGFPTTSGVVQTGFGGDGNPNGAYGTQDGFFTKLSLDGSNVLWSTYIGGNDRSFFRDIAIDGSGNVYGIMTEVSKNNPHITSGAFQTSLSGGEDSVVIKLNSTATSVIWATYFGGSGYDLGTPSIRVSTTGSNVWIAGNTHSTNTPTAAAYDSTLSGTSDMYLGKLNSTGTALVFGTYFGGTGGEFSETHGLAIDSSGNAYLAATTTSSNLPTTVGAYDRTYGGSGGSGTGAGTNYSGDGFVAKFSTTGTFLAATYVGGSLGEGIEGIGLDSSNQVVIGGASYSTNFPTTPGAFRTTKSGSADMIIAVLSNNLSSLIYSSYVGGNSIDLGRTAWADSFGVYVAGEADSTNFPIVNPYQDTFQGGTGDGVLVKLTTSGPTPTPTGTPTPVPSPTATPTPTPVPNPTPTPSPSPTPTPGPLPTPTTGKYFYVSPTGSATGDGSTAKPWNLVTAFSHPKAVKPGDTIWVRGGNYNGVFSSTLAGTAAAPIIVRAIPGERVTIDLNNGVNNDYRAFQLRGGHTWYWGFEITDSHPVRSTNQSGSHPTDVPRGYSSVTIFGSGIKLINSVAHDLGVGVRFQPAVAIDSEVYGLITYNNGFHGPDRGHGHNIYIQNETGTKKVSDSILGNNFRNGINAYAEGGKVKNLVFDGIIVFNSGSLEALFPTTESIRREVNLLVGTTTNPASNIKVLNSHFHIPNGTYGTNVQMGYQGNGGDDLEVSDNYMSGGFRALQLIRWTNSSVRRNTIVRYRAKYTNPVFVDFVGTAATSINQNAYYDALPNSDGKAFASNGAVDAFAFWKALGFDLNSTYQIGKPLPEVFVRPNAYEPGRAHIVVYNWNNSNVATVDLSTTRLSVGDDYEIRDVQNLYGAPVFSGKYDGNVIQLSLANRVVATPIGMTQSTTHTGSDFFVFVVMRR